MKTFILIILSVLSFTNVFSQEESRYEMNLNIEFNGAKTKLKVSNVSYSLNSYVVEPDPTATVPVKQEPIYLSVSTTDTLTKDFFKIFESVKNKANGFIEIKDNFGKTPTRKIEFKNSSVQISENLSNYANGNSTSITIYGTVVIIDGVAVFSK